ncbi:MAG: EAL domain-containing protein [Gammaproteobacteria bacterium]|nr:EAL domain-containing protein [Gammaproteobacteria bacterium]
MPNNTNAFPSIERIDSRLIWSFGLLILVVISIFTSFAGFYYQNVMEKEEQRLALLSSHLLNTAITRTSFSGKYHTRLLIEEIANSFEDINYIEIVDVNGLIIGHSDVSKNGQKVDVEIASSIINEEKPFLVHNVNNNVGAIEILLPYRSGYQNELIGFVRVSISTQVINSDTYNGLVYLMVLVLSLLIISLFLVSKLSHYFAKPVFFMADILKGILDHAPVLIAIQDRHGQLLQNSQSYQHFFSDSGAKFEHNQNFSQILNWGNNDDGQSNVLRENLMDIPINHELKTLRALHFPISLDRQGKPSLICCIAEDITEKHQIEQKLESSEKQMQMVLQGASLGFWDWDFLTGAHDVDLIWKQQLGISGPELEYSINDWDKRIHPEDRQATIDVVQDAIAKKINYTVEFRMKHSSGHWIWIQGSGAVVEWDEKGKPLRLCGTHQDISHRKRSEEELLFLANYDHLTHLPNRNLLQEEIKLLLNHKCLSNNQLALFFIDLDNFKMVNDTYGHDFGDLLLINVAGKIKRIIRDEDVLARFGGDEFVLVINDANNLDSLSVIAQKIINIMKEPVILKKQAIYSGVSIGISVFPHDGDNFSLLLRNADTAMYKAKGAGRNQFCFYTSQMNDEIQHHLNIASRLQKALENNENTNELYMVYQPQVDLQTGKIKSCEALLRWEDPAKGIISPAEFIPIAEKSSLIIDLGDWVFDQVCKQRKEWRDIGIDDLRVDVNLSSRQFSDTAAVNKVRAIMKKYQLETNDIGIELTESALIDGDEYTTTSIYEFREMGFEISLDDFGTGYSSLSYIKRFPISNIKIDRAFIIDAPHKTDDAAIVRAIVAMAESLELNVIAEGVETEAQYQFLLQSGCQYIQGYYFYKPMLANELLKVLNEPSN